MPADPQPLDEAIGRVRDRMERDTRGQTHDGSETGTGAWWTRQSYDDLRTILADHARLTAAQADMPTIWEDPAGKGYPCFERAMTGAEAGAEVERLRSRVGVLESAFLAIRDADARRKMFSDLVIEIHQIARAALVDREG